MIRRNQKAKWDARRAKRHRLKRLGRKEGDYVRPERGACDERSFIQSIDDAYLMRIEVRTWRQGGRMVDFHLALQHRVWDTWEWSTAARMDICHGHAHAHLVVDGADVPGDPQHVHRVDSLEDVPEAYNQSVKHLMQLGIDATRHKGGLG